MARLVAQITAAFILAISVIALTFGGAIGADIPPESQAALGIITGTAGTFLFLSKTKNNGTLISTDTS